MYQHELNIVKGAKENAAQISPRLFAALTELEKQIEKERVNQVAYNANEFTFFHGTKETINLSSAGGEYTLSKMTEEEALDIAKGAALIFAAGYNPSDTPKAPADAPMSAEDFQAMQEGAKMEEQLQDAPKPSKGG